MSFWAPNKIMIQVFNHVTSFLFYMLIGGTFGCVSMGYPKGSISGPRVKVAAELIRLSGYFFGMKVSDFTENEVSGLTYGCLFSPIAFSKVPCIPSFDSRSLDTFQCGAAC